MTVAREYAPNRTLLILLADDDPDDRMFAEDALREARFNEELSFVNDGVELLEYLTRSGSYTELQETPLPSLILLDLSMPRMDGHEALQEIKRNPDLRQIPIVVMTTSNSETDVLKAYALGANSFIVKPSSFRELVEVMADLTQYWFERSELPAS